MQIVQGLGLKLKILEILNFTFSYSHMLSYSQFQNMYGII